MTKSFQMIHTPSALQDMADRVRGESCMALDTEFVWDRTYYARLGLVQVGLSDGTCYLMDPLALPDLGVLGAWLADERILKILHDSPQDLMILQRATGMAARSVFDTRMAAGFAGLESTLSLGRLLEELLGVHLEKAHTRADWTSRPLSPEELEYAADDVRYLPRAAGCLRERAQSAGTEAWLNEELAALNAESTYGEKPPEEAYLRIRAAASLSPRQRAVLRELASWREREARQRDLPRRWLIEDRDLMDMAMAMPGPQDALPVSSRTIQRHEPALREAIRRGREVPDADCPPPVFQAERDAASRKAVDSAMAGIQRHAAVRKIDPALVCSRTEMAMLLQGGGGTGGEAHRLRGGWRAAFLREAGVSLPPADASARSLGMTFQLPGMT
ncbi:MAG: ribonuclease D [Lentisphaerae bacterium]|nr:ribonuclease D [Lentisphaerota bacterium]